MHAHTAWGLLIEALVVGLAAAAVSAILIIMMKPLFARYAMARPNARSSHTVPTPQGGGAALIIATLAVSLIAAFFIPEIKLDQVWKLFLAVLALSMVGGADDIRTIAVLPRLTLQLLLVVIVVSTLPSDIKVVPAIPLWIERIAEMFAGLWLVNLVNFMDGIDWMTVAEVLPVTFGLTLIGLLGALPPECTLVAAALFGATAGFAPFNRPIASLFLGDVGSLPIGLLLMWLLLLLAGRGFLCAAILLPLYYIADATVTLINRLSRGENILEAHRTHFYQLAIQRGLTVKDVVARVAIVNIALVALAIVSVWLRAWAADLLLLVVGCALVTGLLHSLSRGKR